RNTHACEVIGNRGRRASLLLLSGKAAHDEAILRAGRGDVPESLPLRSALVLLLLAEPGPLRRLFIALRVLERNPGPADHEPGPGVPVRVTRDVTPEHHWPLETLGAVDRGDRDDVVALAVEAGASFLISALARFTNHPEEVADALLRLLPSHSDELSHVRDRLFAIPLPKTQTDERRPAHDV